MCFRKKKKCLWILVEILDRVNHKWYNKEKGMSNMENKKVRLEDIFEIIRETLPIEIHDILEIEDENSIAIVIEDLIQNILDNID